KCRPHRYRSNSFPPLESLIVDVQFPAIQPGFQGIEIELDVPGNGMTRRQIFGFDLGAATGAIELDHPHPQGIGSKGVLPVNDWRVDFAGITIIEQQSLLVVVTRRAQSLAAAVADPHFAVELEVEVFSNTDASITVACHADLPPAV